MRADRLIPAGTKMKRSTRVENGSPVTSAIGREAQEYISGL
jgi:hypothetical protein